MRYPSEKGFTLIELIVVLVIMAIGVAVVGVSVSRTMKKSTMKKQVARVHGTLRHARDTSLMTRMPVSFSVDAENELYWVERDEDIVGTIYELPPGFDLEGGAIVFFPKGDSTGGRITITQEDGRGFAIDVDRITGTARVAGI